MGEELKRRPRTDRILLHPIILFHPGITALDYNEVRNFIVGGKIQIEFPVAIEH